MIKIQRYRFTSNKQTKIKRQNYLCQMPTLYPGTFFSSVTIKSSDNSPHTSTKALSRRTPAINKAYYSTLSGILPMLKCTDLQNKVNTAWWSSNCNQQESCEYTKMPTKLPNFLVTTPKKTMSLLWWTQEFFVFFF